MNATSVDDLDVNRSNTETLSTMELFANPEAVEVEMHVFLNAAEDGTFENGTMATPDFTLKPIAENRDPIYFTAEDYTEPLSDHFRLVDAWRLRFVVQSNGSLG